MTNRVDLITDHNKAFPKVDHDRFYNLGSTFTQFVIYNGDKPIARQKFIFKINDFRVRTKKSQTLEVALSKNTSTESFIEFITQLDKIIYNYVKRFLKEFRFKKSFQQYNSYIVLLLNINKTNIINQNHTLETYDSIMEDDIIDIVFELSNILVGPDEYWVAYSALEIRVKNTFFSFFGDPIIDPDIPLPPPMTNDEPEPLPITIPHIVIKKSSPKKNTPIANSSGGIQTDFLADLQQGIARHQAKKKNQQSNSM